MVQSQSKIFKNRFNNNRAVWRILFYSIIVVFLFWLLGIIEKSFLAVQGENYSDYAIIFARFIKKVLRFLAVFLPGIALLKWFDRRPITLLGLGIYKGIVKEIARGMLMGFTVISLSVIIQVVFGTASLSFQGLSIYLIVYVLSALVVLIISAAYEEALFRGYIFQALIEGTNIWVTLGIFSVIFGLAHLNNEGISVYDIVVAIFAAILLGTIYYRTRSLWMCIGAHFTWNWSIGPLFGIGIQDSEVLRHSLFIFTTNNNYLVNGKSVINDILISVLVLILSVYLWKAKWLKPNEFNRKLWLNYLVKKGEGSRG